MTLDVFNHYIISKPAPPVSRLHSSAYLQMPQYLLLACEPLLAIPGAASPEAVVVRAPAADVSRGDVRRERVARAERLRASRPATHMRRGRGAVVLGHRRRRAVRGGSRGRRGARVGGWGGGASVGISGIVARGGDRCGGRERVRLWLRLYYRCGRVGEETLHLVGCLLLLWRTSGQPKMILEEVAGEEPQCAVDRVPSGWSWDRLWRWVELAVCPEARERIRIHTRIIDLLLYLRRVRDLGARGEA